MSSQSNAVRPVSAAGTKEDARALQEKLSSILTPEPSGVGPAPSDAPDSAVTPLDAAGSKEPEIGPPIERRKQTTVRVWFGRLAKTAVALTVLAAVVWAPMRVMLQSSSVEAVVNARLVVLRSPIEGRVVADGLPTPGSSLTAAQTLMRIENPRIDRTAVEGFQQQLAALAAERPALEYRIAKARVLAADLKKQIADFRDARLAVLDIDIRVLDQQIAAQVERTRLAANEASRAGRLKQAGILADAAAEKAAGGEILAQTALAEFGLRRDRLAVERNALSKGIYVGDSYNDRPQSAQRLDEVNRQIDELEAGLAENQTRTEMLALALQQAQAQQDLTSEAEIVAARPARVWEVLASPGEQVNRGQDLVRLLACDEAVVTASVSEGVYNTLHNGMPAAFIPRGSTEELQGRIVNLTGMAGASSNYAIDPAALAQEPYRVTVAIPELASGTNCAIGRTGRVMFGDAALQSMTNRMMIRLRSYFQ